MDLVPATGWSLLKLLALGTLLPLAKARRAWFLLSPKKYKPSAEVAFSSQDGVQLRGWFLPSAPTSRGDSVIICHGWQQNRTEGQQLGVSLNKRGYNVLLFDFRACGRSQGKSSSTGQEEINDLLGALSYMRSKPETQAGKIGIVGLSMGAAVSLVTASRTDEISAIVADSSFATLDWSMKWMMDLYHILPETVFGKVKKSLVRQIKRRLALAIRPVEAVKHISPRPLLLIHGLNDRIVPAEHSQYLYRAAKEPKELWLVEGAGHCMARFIRPREYLERVDMFFRRSFQWPDLRHPSSFPIVGTNSFWVGKGERTRW